MELVGRVGLEPGQRDRVVGDFIGVRDGLIDRVTQLAIEHLAVRRLVRAPGDHGRRVVDFSGTDVRDRRRGIIDYICDGEHSGAGAHHAARMCDHDVRRSRWRVVGDREGQRHRVTGVHGQGLDLNARVRDGNRVPAAEVRAGDDHVQLGPLLRDGGGGGSQHGSWPAAVFVRVTGFTGRVGGGGGEIPRHAVGKAVGRGFRHVSDVVRIRVLTRSCASIEPVAGGALGWVPRNVNLARDHRRYGNKYRESDAQRASRRSLCTHRCPLMVSACRSDLGACRFRATYMSRLITSAVRDFLARAGRWVARREHEFLGCEIEREGFSVSVVRRQSVSGRAADSGTS